MFIVPIKLKVTSCLLNTLKIKTDTPMIRPRAHDSGEHRAITRSTRTLPTFVKILKMCF